MAYLVFILVSLALLGGFVALTHYETRRDTRFFAHKRDYLDQAVKHIEFVLAHIDLGAFVREEVRRLAARISHDLAHLSLQAVRTTERLLTRLVRHLRSRHTIDTVDTVPRENVREFVRTLSDFKGKLKATHPEVGEIK